MFTLLTFCIITILDTLFVNILEISSKLFAKTDFEELGLVDSVLVSFLGHLRPRKW